MDSAMEGVPSASISSFSHRDNSPAVPFAVAVGVVLRHWEFVHAICLGFGGLSITEVVSASITVIIGTTLNYFLDDRINRAHILFPGVGCFFFPVRLGSAVLSSNIADDEAKLNNLSDDCKYGAKRWKLYIVM
ncbi:hypothetical protein K1719_017411 [Acacia pycnantha]|nr:hypothetical protein K1719_017411 [Acacia pycnantha]